MKGTTMSRTSKKSSESSAVEVRDSAPVSTKSEVVTEGGTFKDFPTMITYFREKIEGVSKMTLTICWEIGYEVNLIKEAAVYGEQTVENFVEQLGMPNMNIKTFYRYAQFARSYTKKDLESALTKPHVGWGAINKLLSIKDKDDREEFENMLASGEIKPSELDTKVGEYMEKQGGGASDTPEAGTRETARNFCKMGKKCLPILEVLKTVLPLALKDIEDLDEIADDESKYTAALEVIYSLREGLEELIPLLKQVKDAAVKVA